MPVNERMRNACASSERWGGLEQFPGGCPLLSPGFCRHLGGLRVLGGGTLRKAVSRPLGKAGAGPCGGRVGDVPEVLAGMEFGDGL